MEDDESFNAMVEACLTAHESGGRPLARQQLLAMTRALLWQLGQEITQRKERRKEILRLTIANEQRSNPQQSRFN